MRVNLLKKITLVVFLLLAMNTVLATAQSTDEPAAPSATQDIAATEEATTEATAEATPLAVLPLEHLVPQIISTRPHDPTAFTEG
ncbi:MAG: hypothetical protein ABI700_08235, partial [Chloroflexota bacterium]